jgi:hypothetical protein
VRALPADVLVDSTVVAHEAWLAPLALPDGPDALGEVFAAVDDDGDGEMDRFDNRVATPHLWAATLVYLTPMASDRPELFDRHEAVLPAAGIPDDVEPPPEAPVDAGPDGGPDGGVPRLSAAGGGCACRAAAAGTHGTGPGWLRSLIASRASTGDPRGQRDRPARPADVVYY